MFTILHNLFITILIMHLSNLIQKRNVKTLLNTLLYISILISFLRPKKKINKFIKVSLYIVKSYLTIKTSNYIIQNLLFNFTYS